MVRRCLLLRAAAAMSRLSRKYFRTRRSRAADGTGVTGVVTGAGVTARRRVSLCSNEFVCGVGKPSPLLACSKVGDRVGNGAPPAESGKDWRRSLSAWPLRHCGALSGDALCIGVSAACVARREAAPVVLATPEDTPCAEGEIFTPRRPRTAAASPTPGLGDGGGAHVEGACSGAGADAACSCCGVAKCVAKGVLTRRSGARAPSRMMWDHHRRWQCVRHTGARVRITEVQWRTRPCNARPPFAPPPRRHATEAHSRQHAATAAVWRPTTGLSCTRLAPGKASSSNNDVTGHIGVRTSDLS